MRYVYSFLFALLVAVACADGGETFQGELTSDSGQDFGQLTVEVQPSGGGNSLERAFVSTDGRFQIHNISAGSYLFVIRDRHGFAVHEQYATIQGFGDISVRLPQIPRQRPLSGVVSIEELRHTPPRDARKAFDKSLKASSKGDVQGTVALLEQAVRIDPEFLQALNNLGGQYIRSGRYDDAVQCFRRAIAIAPKIPMLHANLAHALLFMKDYLAAEGSARKAIAMNSSDPMAPRAQLALGLALAGRGEYDGARHVMVTCTESTDEVVRRVAAEFLARLR